MKEESINIIAILKSLWIKRIFIIKTSLLFFFIGCFVALFSPVKYTSQTTFVPQVSDSEVSTTDKKLGSLAYLAGIKINPAEVSNDSYLSPFVYKNIIDSEEFSLELLDEDLINSNAEKFKVREYLSSENSLFNFSLIRFLKKYTFGLFLNNEINKVNDVVFKNFNFINEADFQLINSFREKFDIELNERHGYVIVYATDKDPLISSQIVQIVTKSLQSKIIEIRTNKIRERLAFSKEQYELKQSEFDVLQKKLAEFKDSNKNISTASFMSELQKLESEYQLQQNILINLASEYNNNKIKLNKDTPIFSVIDEVSIPNVKSKPNRVFIVITFVFLGLLISSGFILCKDFLIDLRKKIIY